MSALLRDPLVLYCEECSRRMPLEESFSGSDGAALCERCWSEQPEPGLRIGDWCAERPATQTVESYDRVVGYVESMEICDHCAEERRQRRVA